MILINCLPPHPPSSCRAKYIFVIYLAVHEEEGGAPCFRIGGAEDNFVFDTFLRFLDRNSICCTGMNSKKSILASEVAQDA